MLELPAQVQCIPFVDALCFGQVMMCCFFFLAKRVMAWREVLRPDHRYLISHLRCEAGKVEQSLFTRHVMSPDRHVTSLERLLRHFQVNTPTGEPWTRAMPGTWRPVSRFFQMARG